MISETTYILGVCAVFVALAVFFAVEAWIASHPRCPECRTRRRKDAHVCPHCQHHFVPSLEGKEA